MKHALALRSQALRFGGFVLNREELLMRRITARLVTLASGAALALAVAGQATVDHHWIL
jgi:hypothetical protein